MGDKFINCDVIAWYRLLVFSIFLGKDIFSCFRVLVVIWDLVAWVSRVSIGGSYLLGGLGCRRFMG